MEIIEMPYKALIKKQVEIALEEIGKIEPWFDQQFNAWIFSNDLYPIECEGKSAEEVIEKYPKYLEVFIEHRMKGKIDNISEKKTTGRGGRKIPMNLSKAFTLFTKFSDDFFAEDRKDAQLPLTYQFKIG